MSEALQEAHDGAKGQHSQEALVLECLDDLIFRLLGLGLVIDTAFLDVLSGGLGALGVTFGCSGGEGIAMEEVLGGLLGLRKGNSA